MTTKERYINLFTDFGFKKIFVSEVNKELLIAFLNSLLPDRSLIYAHRTNRSQCIELLMWTFVCPENS